jgi:hypothetical protein
MTEGSPERSTQSATAITVCGVRNPQTHGHVDPSAREMLHLLCLASLLTCQQQWVNVVPSMLTSAMEREDWLMATLPALLVVLPEHQRAVYDVVTARLGDAPVERTAGKEKT